MLYDVLPPLVFFASLGGVILIVSRAVLRIRRQQFEFNIRNHAAAVAQRGIQNPKQLASVIGPARRRIQSFASPLALARHALSTSAQRVKSQSTHLRHRLRTWRSSRTSHPPAPSTNPPQRTEQASQQIQPPKASLFQHLSTRLSRSRPSKAESRRTAPAAQPKKPAVTPPVVASSASSPQSTKAAKPESNAAPVIKRHTLRRSDQPETPTTPPPSKATIASSTATAAPPAPTKTSRPNLSKLFPPKKKTHPKTSVVAEAQRALSESHPDQAEALLVPYLCEHPRDARAYMVLGRAAIAKEEWDDAIAAFEQVVTLNPTTPDGYAQLGHATYRAGHFTRAIELLQQAHAAEPNNQQIIEDLLTIAQRLDNIPMQQSLQEELAELRN